MQHKGPCFVLIVYYLQTAYLYYSKQFLQKYDTFLQQNRRLCGPNSKIIHFDASTPTDDRMPGPLVCANNNQAENDHKAAKK